MTTALEYAKEHAERFRHELHDLLRIPSISTDQDYAPQVRQAADWLMAHFRALGLTVELLEMPERHPMVYAEYMGAGANAKTVLVYGHYDVQPAVDDKWLTNPFEPVEKDGKIYARGATDDKGQAFVHIKAIEALLKAEGGCPVNVKFILEGEEESGSRFIKQFVAEQGQKLQADVCVVSDTSMKSIEQPVIIVGLRGGIGFQINVTGPKQDLHSGMYGGSVHNPLQALAEILSQLHHADGSVAVTGFYDDVQELSASERAQIAAIPWDKADWADETGAPLPWGEANYSLRERVGARPTLEIIGMSGGYIGNGMMSIVPNKAFAKISCRLVANQDPEIVYQKTQTFIQKITPSTVQVELVRINAGSRAVLIPTDTPSIQAAIRAYERGWGTKPVFMREGGSIPIVLDFKEKLNMPTVLMGFGLDTDNLHGPNEHFSIAMFHKGIDTAIHFFKEAASL